MGGDYRRSDRLCAVAKDFIHHYETRVAEGATVAGKATFVCMNRNIAYDLYKIIVEMRPQWSEKRKSVKMKQRLPIKRKGTEAY